MNVVVLDKNSITVLPSDVSDCDAVALPVIALVPWLALVEYAPISSSSVILLHDASTRKFVVNHVACGLLCFQTLDLVLCNFVSDLALNSSVPYQQLAPLQLRPYILNIGCINGWVGEQLTTILIFADDPEIDVNG